MTDIVDSGTRGRIMARIRSRDTGPEMAVRRWLHARGFRFRLHRRDLPGTPDIVLPKWRLAVFVNGCFWHAHEGCPKFRVPKTRTEWWEEKFRRNVERDARACRELEAAGWRVLVLWECRVRDGGFAKDIQEVLGVGSRPTDV